MQNRVVAAHSAAEKAEYPLAQEPVVLVCCRSRGIANLCCGAADSPAAEENLPAAYLPNSIVELPDPAAEEEVKGALAFNSLLEGREVFLQELRIGHPNHTCRSVEYKSHHGQYTKHSAGASCRVFANPDDGKHKSHKITAGNQGKYKSPHPKCNRRSLGAGNRGKGLTHSNSIVRKRTAASMPFIFTAAINLTNTPLCGRLSAL